MHFANSLTSFRRVCVEKFFFPERYRGNDGNAYNDKLSLTKAGTKVF